MNYRSLYAITTFTLLTVLAQLGWAGGADTGGGNASSSDRVSARDIEEFLKEARFPIKYILRRIEFISQISTDGYLKELNRKLFHGRQTVYFILDGVTFLPKSDGPCHDTDGSEVDGSAVNAPALCFSLPRLESKLNKDSLAPQVLGLMIHELSHAAGANEFEANIAQSFVKTSITNDPTKKIPNLVASYTSLARDQVESIDALVKMVSTDTDQALCMGLGSISGGVSQMLNKSMDGMSETEMNGISLLAPREISRMQGTVIKSINILRYCMDGPAYKKMEDAFQGRSEMDIQEFVNGMMGTQPTSQSIPYPQWTIRNVQRGNKAALLLELRDIQKSLHSVLNNI